MIWLSMLIPLIALAVLIYLFRHKLVWWEVIILLGVPALVVLLMSAMVQIGLTSDTEYWGGFVAQAEYYEDWDERVSCSHPISCTHTQYCTDSKGSSYACGTQHFNDGYYHDYDVDYHPEYWQVIDSNGIRFPISKAKFEELAERWGNRQFVELNRRCHSNDGDLYKSLWDWHAQSVEATSTAHTYENRIAVSDSILNYPEVSEETKKTYALFDYPPITGYYQPAILGIQDVEAEKKFQYINGLLGRSKQIKVFVLVFQEQSIQASFEQEALWKRGNKNELVITVGVDASLKPTWARAFSWSDSEMLKIEAADFLMKQSRLELRSFADWLYPQIEQNWIRKPFAEFSYLNVEPPAWAITLAFILVTLITGGISWWIVANEFEGETHEKDHHRIGSRRAGSRRADRRDRLHKLFK